jgi:RNA polymerase sigma-70 factor, ECF subfamily
MSNITDATLLARFRDGDETALDALLARYEQDLFRFLVGLLRDVHRAEDALQETFVRALEKGDDIDPDHLRGWLFTVAYHQAMLIRRRERVKAETLPEVAAPDADPGELAARRDDSRRLRLLLGLLPPSQQEVLRQRVYEGKRFRDIAEALGCPLNTALARMHDGLKRLRLLWGKDHV